MQQYLTKPSWLRLYGSGRPKVFWKEGVLRNFAKFTVKHLCQSFFFKCLPVNFAKFLKTEIQNTSGGCFCLYFFQVALLLCCTFIVLQSFHVALFLYWEITQMNKRQKTQPKNRHYTQHRKLASFLFWYPIKHFCHYIVLSGW